MKVLLIPTAIILGILTAAFNNVHAATTVTVTTLYQFSGGDGEYPEGGVSQGSDGNLYGTTDDGGYGFGTIFVITPQGTLTTLYDFSGYDGEEPVEAPVQGSDSNFYGTTYLGGNSTNCSDGCGTIYKITSAGTLTTLYSFSGPDGANPRGLLVQGTNGNFYGTTKLGGTSGNCPSGCGTVYKITPQGTLTTLYSFSLTDGAIPDSSPIQGADGNFYGTTYTGGSAGTVAKGSANDGFESQENPPGTVYQLTPAGTLTTLHAFSGPDGANPGKGAVQGTNGAFFGVTLFGGASDKGTVYTITSAGTFTSLHSFTGDGDGEYSKAQLAIGSDGNFYGTTIYGGTSTLCGSDGCGSAFRITPEGTLTTLYLFPGDPEPALPVAGVIQGSDGNFYGTSYTGGTNHIGTVYRLSVCDVSINSTNAFIPKIGGGGGVGVIASSNCNWTAVSNDSFITITSGSSGIGNGTVDYTVTTNATTKTRTGTMTIGGETFTVTQFAVFSTNGCTYVLNESSVAVPAKGGSKTVSVKTGGTGCDWTAVSNDPFITINSGSMGTGSGTVDFTVAGNTNTTAQTGSMTIAYQTVTVNQVAGGCTFKLSPKAGKLKATGGTAAIKVTPNLSDCDWTAVSNDGFITITGGASGTGKGAVTYSVPANATTNILTGTITVAGQTFTVTQAGVK